MLFQVFSIVLVGIAGLKIQPKRMPDISYGIYIYHLPIILYLYNKHNIRTINEMLLYGCLSVVFLSFISWYLIEKPALRFKQRGYPLSASIPINEQIKP